MTVAADSTLSQLSNSLVTSSQLQDFQSNDDNQSKSVRFAQYHLTQTAGILLRLPQEVIATAIVLLQRYLVAAGSKDSVNHKSKSTTIPDQFSPRLLSAAAIYVTAKTSFTPLSPRSIINVFAYLSSSASPLWYMNSKGATSENLSNPSDTNAQNRDSAPDPRSYYVSEGTYQTERLALFKAESSLLASLGFDTHVALPHKLALTYLSALLPPASSTNPSPAHPTQQTRTALTARVVAQLNTALLSPQLLYLTHQPNALAVAAIYLSAKETGVKLPEQNWWQVFDVDREALGFLVLGMGSVGNYVEAEQKKCLETEKRWKDDLG